MHSTKLVISNVVGGNGAAAEDASERGTSAEIDICWTYHC